MARPNKLIQFYMVDVCNSRCCTCSIWKNKIRKEIQLNKVKKIIKDFPRADYVFGGGEFTLYTQKDKLLDFCDKNNVNYTVLSNAVSLGMLEDLINKHNIKNLTMSCDGVNHDMIRGIKGNLRNIEYIVNTYRDKIPNIKLSYTLSSFNEFTIDKDMEYFKSLGFNKIYFCIAQNMDLLKAEGIITPGFKRVQYLYDNYRDMLYDKDVQLLEDIISKHTGSGTLRKCGSIGDVHTIYTNGDVVRCQSLLSNKVLGNINYEGFYDIIKRDEANRCGILEFSCPYNNDCELVCQRRYDYEDRV